jgi:hypothetical protein
MATSNQFELNLLTLGFPFSLMLSPIFFKKLVTTLVVHLTKSLGNFGTFLFF